MCVYFFLIGFGVEVTLEKLVVGYRAMRFLGVVQTETIDFVMTGIWVTFKTKS